MGLPRWRRVEAAAAGVSLVALGDEDEEVLEVLEVAVVAVVELGGGLKMVETVVAVMAVEVEAGLAVEAVVLAVVLVGEGGVEAVEGVGIDPPPKPVTRPSGLVCVSFTTDSRVGGSKDPNGQPPRGALSPPRKPPTEGGVFGREGKGVVLLSLGGVVVEVSEALGEVMLEAVGLERAGLVAGLVVRMILAELDELDGELGDEGKGVGAEQELVRTNRLSSSAASFFAFKLSFFCSSNASFLCFLVRLLLVRW